MVTLPERRWGAQISRGERNKARKEVMGKESSWTGAAAKPEVQWIETEISCRAEQRSAGAGMEIELLGSGARLRIRDERDAELAVVVLRGMGGGVC